MRRITTILKWKLRVGGSVDAGLKTRMEVFFEDVMPGLVIGLMVLVVMVHSLGK